MRVSTNDSMSSSDASDTSRSRARTVTGAIEAPLSAADVMAVLADASRLPSWAPGFADHVDGDTRAGWQVSKDGHRFALQVRVNDEAGTVDYLREVAPGHYGGAYLRTTPRPGNGSVTTMTMPVPADEDPLRSAAVLDAELGNLARLLDTLGRKGTA